MAGDPLKKGRYTNFGNKIGLFSNKTGNFICNSPEVVLNFPFKDTVLEAGMTKEDSSREERFLHIEMDAKDIDTLEDPKVLTNFKYIDQSGEHALDENSNIEFFDENGELKQNLLIKGNNLLALHTLKEKLTGKIKLIYIDPPYNTENDGFRYNDSFNHSSWLTFMRNRLEIAKELLALNGSIYVNIDYNEVHYLKVLMDEIFGINNFQREIIRKMGFLSGYKTSANNYIRNHDTILFYTKSSENMFFNKVYLQNNDFAPILKDSKDLRKYLINQCIIEPKGGHILEHDQWKEDALLDIHENSGVSYNSTRKDTKADIEFMEKIKAQGYQEVKNIGLVFFNSDSEENLFKFVNDFESKLL